MGCLASDLLELLYKEDYKPENLTELIKCIIIKGENVWSQRRKLHQMTKETGESVSKYAARLRDQAKRCEYIVTCKGNRCNLPNEFTDTVVMGELVWGLVDYETNEVNQIGDLAALIKLVEAKENEMHSPCELGNIDSSGDSNNDVKCHNYGIDQPRLREWKERCPANKKQATAAKDENKGRLEYGGLTERVDRKLQKKLPHQRIQPTMNKVTTRYKKWLTIQWLKFHPMPKLNID